MSERKLASRDMRAGIADRLLAALRADGKNLDDLSPIDLASHDQMHPRGHAATAELAAHLTIGPEARVLDVGCGLGGSARYLAERFGCSVVGIERDGETADAGRMLSRLTGLAALVDIRKGDAFNMPFEDASFDVVWTQSFGMTVADLATLYAGLRRLLKPDGRLVLDDPVLGPGGPPIFPLPWADGADSCFLVSPEHLRATLEEAGFEVLVWEETSSLVLGWLGQMVEVAEVAEAGSLARRVVRFANARRNFAERRILQMRAVIAPRAAA